MLGVIGGSGIYDLEGLTQASWRKVETPFGRPSDDILVGEFQGVKVAFLPRHGRGHKTPPNLLNVRANIAALKTLGCTEVISLSAVGSLREDLPPGTLVAVDQFIDNTKGRPSSFFGEGVVAHVSMAHPVCGRLVDLVDAAAKEAEVPWRKGSTYVCIEGPQFSTKAESEVYRSWRADLIGMTAMPEVKLAREAELCLTTVAMVTDFDCWHPDHDAVTAAQVVSTFSANIVKARKLLEKVIPKLKDRKPGPCAKGCNHALEGAILTSPNAREASKLRQLASAGLSLKTEPARTLSFEDPHGLKAMIRTVPDWPKKGIQFRDVTTLLEDPRGLRAVTDAFLDRYKAQRIDKVVGIDARGFIFGSALALELGVGFVPVRKKGKLPGTNIRVDYSLEYGTDTVEIRAEALGAGQRVLVIDDLIATGGTAEAAVRLCRLRGADVVECAFVVDLPDLKGRGRLERLGVKSHALCQFEGD